MTAQADGGPALVRFCFEHDGLFLVPAEELSDAGLDPEFAGLLQQRGLASPQWCERFGLAFQRYWQRALELSKRAGKTWLPPRSANVCIARDPLRVRPFFQPLGRASWLLDQADFEPATASLELSTYRFFLAERRQLLRQVAPAPVHDLAYWLVRSPEEIRDFQAGCRRAAGCEAAGWRALARALEWIRAGFHGTLKPAPAGASASAFALPGTGVLLPASARGELERLARAWSDAARQRVQAFQAAQAPRKGSEAAELADWIAARRPLLLVTGQRGEILWDPERPGEVARLRAELASVSAAGAERLRLDWSVVDQRSRAFLGSLVQPEDLPAPGAELDQDGLAYLHRQRKLVAYGLHEPRMQRLHEPAPPFERWMLGARTIHEWGHLAAAAGWVPVPAGRRSEFAAARGELAELLDAVVQAAPAFLRAQAARELFLLAQRAPTPGAALVELLLERMADYQSNLLARRYLSPEERETYVRNNVRPLLGELDSTRPFQALVRYAFEYQYLSFGACRDARGYFLATTWFAQQFLARGVLSEERCERLLDATARLCRCHAVDEARFSGPTGP